MGSVKIGRPVSQHRPLPLPDVGGPPDVAEHGEVLRAPGGTVVVVTAIGTGAAGGEDGADGAEGVVLCKGETRNKVVKDKVIIIC